jgi:hypothetical protein
MQWAPRAHPVVKRPGPEAGHLSSTTAEVKKTWIYTSTLSIRPYGLVLRLLSTRTTFHVTWVPVPTAWRVLGLRMEERPPAMEGNCEYILNKQPRTNDKGWSSSVGLGRGADNLQKKQTPWPESASEPYRPSDRRLSAEFLPTFADRGCRVVSTVDPHGRIF